MAENEQLTKDEIEKRIIAGLETSNVFKPCKFGTAVFIVYGEKFATDKKNSMFYELTVFDLLSELEANNIVKNVNRLPISDKIKIMQASQWVLTSKL